MPWDSRIVVHKLDKIRIHRKSIILKGSLWRLTGNVGYQSQLPY